MAFALTFAVWARARAWCRRATSARYATTTEWATVAAATVAGAPAPLEPLPPPGPLPCVSKTTLRASRLLPAALVSCESIGKPIVTQSTATNGSAKTIGRKRERARGVVARGARIRLGLSMYECRMVFLSAAAGLDCRVGRRRSA
jgi:hypothetical protein